MPELTPLEIHNKKVLDNLDKPELTEDQIQIRVQNRYLERIALALEAIAINMERRTD